MQALLLEPNCVVCFLFLTILHDDFSTALVIHRRTGIWIMYSESCETIGRDLLLLSRYLSEWNWGKLRKSSVRIPELAEKWTGTSRIRSRRTNYPTSQRTAVTGIIPDFVSLNLLIAAFTTYSIIYRHQTESYRKVSLGSHVIVLRYIKSA
jgi:hypothetical protein